MPQVDSTVGNFLFLLFTRHYGACFCPFCLSRTASSLDKTTFICPIYPPVHQATQYVFLLRVFNTTLVSCIHASFLFIKYPPVLYATECMFLSIKCPPVHWSTEHVILSLLFVKYRQFTRRHRACFYSSSTASSQGDTTFVSMRHFYSSSTASSQDSRACFCPFYPSSSRLFISQHSMCVFVLSIHQVRPVHKTTQGVSLLFTKYRQFTRQHRAFLFYSSSTVSSQDNTGRFSSIYQGPSVL